MAAGYCPQCGTQRQGNLRYCPSCAFDFWAAAAGHQTSQPQPTGPVPDAPPPPPTPPRQSRIWTQSRPANVLAVVLLSGLGILFVWTQLNQSAGPSTPPDDQVTERPADVAPQPEWRLTVGDTTYTTETSVGGTIEVTAPVSNSGSEANRSTELQFSDFTDYVDIVGCNPTCAVNEFLGDIYAEVGGIPAGDSAVIVVQFIATAVGAAQWSVCVYDDAVAGDQIYCGNATTVIR